MVCLILWAVPLNVSETLPLYFLLYRSLLIVRSQYGQLDDGARFHVFSHLILETVICGKSMLVTNILGRDDSMDVNNKETGFILSFIQKDRVLAAVCFFALSFYLYLELFCRRT